MHVIEIETKPAYKIHLAPKILPEDWMESLDKSIQRLVIISDETVGALYGQAFVEIFRKKYACDLLTFPAGEFFKTRETKALLEDGLSALGCRRDTLIIALGGGVVCDLAGFVAATYHRGIPCSYWPTTLLAIVDAAVGGKTAVNTPYGKNLIGTFTQPQSVEISLELLKTLPAIEWKAGIAEMIKHALLQGVEAERELQQHGMALRSQTVEALVTLIESNIQYKASVIIQDPCEQGLRASLNVGHTFAHMVEAASNYQVTHGSAVLWGMYWEACLGVWLGMTEQALPSQIQALYEVCGVSIPQVVWQPEGWLNFLKQDKKNHGKHDEIGFTLLAKPGQIVADKKIVTKLRLHDIEQFFTEMQSV